MSVRGKIFPEYWVDCHACRSARACGENARPKAAASETATQRQHEKELTAKQIPLLDLMDALNKHSGALKAWMDNPKPPDTQGGFLVGRDVRLHDFTPLDTWVRVWNILCAAEQAAEDLLKSGKH